MKRSHFSVKLDPVVSDRVYSKVEEMFKSSDLNITNKGDNLFIALSLTGSNFWVVQKHPEEHAIEFDVWHNQSRPPILKKIMAMIDREKALEKEV